MKTYIIDDSLGFRNPNGSLIDFHSHILPDMDDGSRSVEESLEMIRTEAEYGVFCIMATPHFYADRDRPENFLEKRSKQLKRLRRCINGSYPILLAGAEVQYYSGLPVMEMLPQFCVENTNLLLVEMPFDKWGNRVLEDIFSLQNRYGIQPVIAHIERYIQYQPPETLEILLQNHVLIQANASFIIDRRTQHRAIRMLEEKKIQLIGSDAHNMTSRPPKLGECYDVLRNVMGSDAMQKVIRESLQLLYQGRMHK